MAGHSKWANIKHTKEREDAKRGKLFAKLAKDIVTATKLGGSGNISDNAMLKVAVDKAKAANMPKNNIDSAIDRGMGKMPEGVTITENTYEFLLNGIAVLVDTETDNSNRTHTELKVVANKSGAKQVPEGSISYQFEEQGNIEFNFLDKDSDGSDLELELMDIQGIEDLEKIDDQDNIIFSVVTAKQDLKGVQERITEKFGKDIEYSAVEIVKSSKNTIEASAELIEKFSSFEDVLRENSDVVNVWNNLE